MATATNQTTQMESTYRVWAPVEGHPDVYEAIRTHDAPPVPMRAGQVIQTIGPHGSRYRRIEVDGVTVPVIRINAADVCEGCARFEEGGR